MHEVIPYILIIIGFHPDLPSPRLVEIRTYQSQADCELQGAEYVAQRENYKIEFGEERFRYFCRRVG